MPWMGVAACRFPTMLKRPETLLACVRSPIMDPASPPKPTQTSAPDATQQDSAVVALPSGVHVPALGQGTWNMGDDAARRQEELAAIRLGIELGLTLIDTAEMYGQGKSENLVGEAIAGLRDDVFLVSKVLPSNAGRRAAIAACERSLRQLRTDRIDLYLLHWRGGTGLQETVDAFETLKADGKIGAWGVSNFDVNDMNELVGFEAGKAVAANQVLFNLTRRGIEFDLVKWQRERSIPVMAYSPLEQGRLLGHKELDQVARRHDATPAQIALAWVLEQPGVIAIPKASTVAHVRENADARSIVLDQSDMALLDRAFPPPGRPRALEML